MEKQITYKYYLKSHFQQFGSLIIELCHYCPVECDHCHVFSNRASKQVIDDETLTQTINDFGKISNSRIIMFTGGDPFAFPAKLKKALALTRINNLKSYTLTSGFWAKKRENANRFLSDFPYIDLFAVSIDQYHADKIGLDAPLNAIYESIDRGFSTFLCIGHMGVTDPFREMVNSSIENKYKDKFEIVYYPLLARGSGSNLPELKGRELSRNSNQFCFSIGAPIVLSNGNISACCHTTQVNKIRNNIKTPLYIGKGSNFSKSINDYLNNNFLKLMRVYGPIKISKLVGLNLPQDAESWDICKSCEYLHETTNIDKINKYLKSLTETEMNYVDTLDYINSSGSIENLIKHYYVSEE